jgi:hypothetical protein
VLPNLGLPGALSQPSQLLATRRSRFACAPRVPFAFKPVSLVERSLTRIGKPLTFVRQPLAQIGKPLTLVRKPLSSLGYLFTQNQSSFERLNGLGQALSALHQPLALGKHRFALSSYSLTVNDGLFLVAQGTLPYPLLVSPGLALDPFHSPRVWQASTVRPPTSGFRAATASWLRVSGKVRSRSGSGQLLFAYE